jgi:hypothetical protein
MYEERQYEKCWFLLLIYVADHSRRIPVHLYLHGKTTHFADASPTENKETPF